MKLYLLRHAIAKDRSKWHRGDSDRPLTDEGARKMRKTARGLKHLKLDFDAILTSPYRRAFSTAEIVGDVLKLKKRIKIVDELASDGEPQKLIKRLSDFPAQSEILLVGHEPYLSRLVSLLIGSKTPLALDFKKGGLCKLSTEGLLYGRSAALEWWLPPKLIKRLE
jgi:phosphohistidine phosphatase